MKIVIAGGHFSPAIAVIEALPSNPNILYVGRKYGLEGDAAETLEYQEVTKRGIPFVSLTTGRLQRRLSLYTLLSLLKIPIGIVQAFLAVQKFRPGVIVVFGGYIALPVALAAWALRIPIVVHEQTLGAGLANRVIGLFADKICISWESSSRFFDRSKTILTGNPVRKFRISNFEFRISNEKIPLIYVTGGSSGAHAINVLIEGCLEKLLHEAQVIHQTGDAKKYKDFERLEEMRSTFSKNLQHRYRVSKFIDPTDVYACIEESELVVSRSGINTVTELFVFQKPAILIPLSFKQDSEQQRNAEFFARFGFGKVYDQKSLTPAIFFAAIVEMLKKRKSYLDAFSKTAVPIHAGAADHIVQVVLSVAGDASS